MNKTVLATETRLVVEVLGLFGRLIGCGLALPVSVRDLSVVQEMKRSDVSDFREKGKWIVDHARIWLWIILAVAVTLYFIHSAPAMYLIVMAMLGFSWGGVLALCWRLERWSICFLLVAFVAASSTIAGRMFRLESQFQDVQGLMVAFTSAGVLFAVFTKHLYRFSRLQTKKEAQQAAP